MMKFALLIVLMYPLAVAAQETDVSVQMPVSSSLQKGTWELGVIGSGGTGLGYASNTHFAAAGGRAGLILTKDHGTGWRRGNFEWAVEAFPLYTVFTPRRAVYGGSFVPAVWRWNFTSGSTITPYASIAGGILFSTRNLPPGNTSWVNFTPQAAIGANFFLKPRGAVTIEGAYIHHSNAGLGTDNPGYNAAFFLTVGYTWFNRRRS
jgi:lipid A 3-O-deacylase